MGAQDMINCSFEDWGCEGGSLVSAVDFLQSEGAVLTKCNRYQEQLNKCMFKCDHPKREKYEKYYCKPKTLRIETDIGKMQKDIYENGPVMMSLLIYDDLPNYKAGVYEWTQGNLTGGHAVRAIGWGHDSTGHLFWLIQN